MKITVEKMSVVFREKGQKDKYLWAFIDEDGHTTVQVYSADYPKEMEELLNSPYEKKKI